jgi:flavin-dependent dehydrogenase
VVVGGGPAGLIAATTAAAQGHRVAMTEQRLTGGTCVNSSVGYSSHNPSPVNRAFETRLRVERFDYCGH